MKKHQLVTILVSIGLSFGIVLVCIVKYFLSYEAQCAKLWTSLLKIDNSIQRS
jgi:hypothetical protein